MEKCVQRVCMVLLMVLCLGQGVVFAGEIDILLQKLVDKGVLTAGEAQEIKTETQEQIKTELAKGTHGSVPQWVQTIKLKGDLRTRYQYEKRKGSNTNLGATTERNRARIRLRVGAEAEVNDQLKVLFGLASGSDSDPRSTNQTFEKTFGKRSIWIDYAYAQYMPFTWLSASAGRMKNTLWEPTDMLWDSDVNPEGLSASLTKKLNAHADLFVNTAWFLLDENANASDPWMFALQPGASLTINDTLGFKLAVTYYGFKQVQGWIPSSDARSAGSNTRLSGGLQYNYNSVTPALELSIKEPLKHVGLGNLLDVPSMSLFAEYIDNLDTSNSHTGYAAGIKFGHSKISDWKQWQAKYQYVFLGTDAWLDTLPDSDRYGGRTGVRSHEASISYGLGKNWSLDLDYYLSQLTNNPSDASAGLLKTEHLFQADLNYKF